MKSPSPSPYAIKGAYNEKPALSFYKFKFMTPVIQLFEVKK